MIELSITLEISSPRLFHKKTPLAVFLMDMTKYPIKDNLGQERVYSGLMLENIIVEKVQ